MKELLLKDPENENSLPNIRNILTACAGGPLHLQKIWLQWSNLLRVISTLMLLEWMRKSGSIRHN
jgi:hypothetical protein